jgi:serine phosphatase RsbU (regulator of sigma subunit)
MISTAAVLLCILGGLAVLGSAALLLYRRFPVHKIYKSKIHLESTFDSIDDPVAIVSGDYRIERANRSYARLVSRPITRVIGNRCHELLRKRPVPCDDCRLKESLEQQTRQYVPHSPHPHGQQAGVMAFTFFPFVKKGELPSSHACVEHIRDITELERAKTALEKKSVILEKMTEELSEAQAILYREIELARQVQQNIFPKSLPEIPGLCIAVSYQPVESIGGDMYDVVPFSQTRAGIFIADASGHGLPAAFMSTIAKMSLYYHTRTELAPAEVLCRMNRDIVTNIQTGHYLTCFYGLFDTQTNQLRYTRAAHPKPIVIRKDGEMLLLQCAGTLLGVLDEYQFQEQTFQCRAGDRIYLFTDGVYVVTVQKGVTKLAFDDKRFQEIVQAHNNLPFEKVIPAIREELSHFTYEDDYTLMVIEVTGKGDGKNG